MRSDFAAPLRCDIFCAVVDNYGDIGVCWRLARQLANEHGVAVRLWVDVLASFHRLCPDVDVQLSQQYCRGVEIRHWTKVFPEVKPAQWVIEAFACKLPESYVAAMAVLKHKPVWINLEYLSAEGWVEGCHRLPSPHPSLPLVKYFFFPGFTPETGGLLLESDLLSRRDVFLNSAVQQQAFWQTTGVTIPAAETLKVSLFAYENHALNRLFDTWASGAKHVLCLVPEGRIKAQVELYFEDASIDSLSTDVIRKGVAWQRGNLEVRILPFLEQEHYDELLWACDINFVRGEDSCVRAQWAGKPFVWHIYPQHDGVHLQKLRAFMKLYCTGLPPDAAHSLHGLWEAWNGGMKSEQVNSSDTWQLWNDFWKHKTVLRKHAHDWAKALSHNSLALNLLDFSRSIDRMRDSKF